MIVKGVSFVSGNHLTVDNLTHTGLEQIMRAQLFNELFSGAFGRESTHISEN